MSIRIATDSGADMEALEFDRLHVELIPMPITVDQRTYLADKNFNKTDFFHMLEKAEIFPTTSQPSPTDMEAVFKSAKQAGDQLIYITLSSALSGTYQTANLVKAMGEYTNVFVVDSLSATLGQKLLVLHAAKLRALGRSAEEIAQELEALKGRIRIFAGIETLEYLYKGGRLSKASASLGTLARIKPVITVTQEGLVQVVGKGLGTAKAMSIVLNFVEKNPVDLDYPVMGVYSGNMDNMTILREKAKKIGLDVSEDQCFSLGPAIGAHVGAGAHGFIYITKE